MARPPWPGWNRLLLRTLTLLASASVSHATATDDQGGIRDLPDPPRDPHTPRTPPAPDRPAGGQPRSGRCPTTRGCGRQGASTVRSGFARSDKKLWLCARSSRHGLPHAAIATVSLLTSEGFPCVTVCRSPPC